jgi:hypothetical protein
MSTQVSDFQGKTYAPAQIKHFFFFFFSEKIHYNFQSPNFLSNKNLLSGRKTAPKGILFLLFLLSVKFLQQHSRISNPIQFSGDSRLKYYLLMRNCHVVLC